MPRSFDIGRNHQPRFGAGTPPVIERRITLPAVRPTAAYGSDLGDFSLFDGAGGIVPRIRLRSA